MIRRSFLYLNILKHLPVRIRVISNTIAEGEIHVNYWLSSALTNQTNKKNIRNPTCNFSKSIKGVDFSIAVAATLKPVNSDSYTTPCSFFGKIVATPVPSWSITPSNQQEEPATTTIWGFTKNHRLKQQRAEKSKSGRRRNERRIDGKFTC